MKLANLKKYSFEDESAWNGMVAVGINGTNTFALGNIDGPSLTLPSYDRASQTIVTDVWQVFQSPDNTIQTLNLPRYSTSVAAGAMANLPELTSADFSDSANYISECAFFGCENIGQIRISENLSLLPDGIFGRTGISKITVPGNISKVRCAFFECSKLHSVALQEGVRSLWQGFAGGSALETITLPESLELISSNTFAGCTSLKDVFFTQAALISMNSLLSQP